MRYILDDLGYISTVSCNSIECDSGTCVEYTGSIPEGYDSLLDWATDANIRAYKIVDGNLTFDADRDAALQAQWNIPYTPANVYSTDESIIGTWIDGKPIYRKLVYVNNLANNTIKNVPCNIGANVIDQMIKHELVWYDSVDRGWMYGKRWDATSIFIEYYYNTAEDYMWIKSVGTDWSVRTSKAYAIFEYTKTTD